MRGADNNLPLGPIKDAQNDPFSALELLLRHSRRGDASLPKRKRKSSQKNLSKNSIFFFSNRQKFVWEGVGEVVKSYIWAELKAEHEFEVGIMWVFNVYEIFSNLYCTEPVLLYNKNPRARSAREAREIF